MNKDNLLKLAALLDRVPEEKFEMYTYARTNRPMGTKPRCATACCALGWATAIPEFGLELRACAGDTDADVYDKATDTFYSGIGGVFGLTRAQAQTLFTSGWGMTAREKAERIRAMVRTGR